MKIIRARQPGFTKKFIGPMVEVEGLPNEVAVQGLINAMESQSDSVYILVAFGEKDEVLAFVIAYATPTMVVIQQVWKAAVVTTAVLYKLLEHIHKWSDGIERKITRIAVDMGDIETHEVFTGLGYKTTKLVLTRSAELENEVLGEVEIPVNAEVEVKDAADTTPSEEPELRTVLTSEIPDEPASGRHIPDEVLKRVERISGVSTEQDTPVGSSGGE